MAPISLSRNMPWRLVISEPHYRRLQQHLFPGDNDEHGLVIAAGLAQGPTGTRLLVRDLFLAVDGRDYVPGKRGYKMLKAEFIRDRVLRCRDERLVYLAVHNHGGTDRVGFSGDDLCSHERGYPALLDIVRGLPVGALVFAKQAVAGDIWLPSGERVALEGASIIGRRLERIAPAPRAPFLLHDPTYDRQARMFGATGQGILKRAKVAIIGLGGVGSLLAEYLGHLGVGHIVLIDPERIEITNLPRVVGSTRWDALSWLQGERFPAWVHRVGRRLSTPKVAIARRVIQRANPSAKVDAVFGNVEAPENAARLSDCDYIFLAADTMQARLLFNAVVYQYLIPGVQLGSKVSVDKESGSLLDVFSVVRPVYPEGGCLWCNGLINRAKLQEEGQGEQELNAQRYVDESEVTAPSVITLNAIAASQGANDFLFYMTGLTRPNATADYLRFHPLQRKVWFDGSRKGEQCPECSSIGSGRYAFGDAKRLPTWVRQ